MPIHNTASTGIQPSSLLELSRNTIIQNIQPNDEVSKKLPIPVTLQQYVENSSVFAARKITKICYEYYKPKHKNIFGKIISLFFKEKNSQLLGDKILYLISKINKNSTLKNFSYASSHDYRNYSFIAADNEYIEDLGDFQFITHYIKTTASHKGQFKNVVAEILLTYYLDPMPNAITLLRGGYADLTRCAKAIDKLKLIDQQKIEYFEELISYIKEYNSDAHLLISRLDINDPRLQFHPRKLRRHFHIKNHPNIELLANELFKHKAKKMTPIKFKCLIDMSATVSSRVNLH